MAKSAKRKTNDPVTTAADHPTRTRIDEATKVTENDIARRAYDLYLARGRETGHQIDDWLQAERELRQASVSRTV